jgi:hypothetical protein
LPAENERSSSISFFCCAADNCHGFRVSISAFLAGDGLLSFVKTGSLQISNPSAHDESTQATNTAQEGTKDGKANGKNSEPAKPRI